MVAVLKRFVVEDNRPVPPFNEPANQLTIGTIPLRLYHETLMSDYFARKGFRLELQPALTDKRQVYAIREPAIAYSDSLWFDEEFLDYFITKAESTGRACRAAIYQDDLCYSTYSYKLAKKPEYGNTANVEPIWLLDLWYLPRGYTLDITPIVVPSDYKEKGFYTVPDFMATEQGNLTHYLPERSVLFIENWIHVYFASIIFGVFARASRIDEAIKKHNLLSLELLWRAIIEQKQVLSTSKVVEVGPGTTIHPTAIITGPAKIGANCSIGPGVIIDNSTIGDNVTIDTGCVVSLSTIANNCFLPFRASLYLTALMENTIVSQNTCLQMCVIGRNSFIGAGNTFTDFNLIGKLANTASERSSFTVPRPISAVNADGDVEDTGQTVLGGAVGHNCRIGSGMVVFPGRTIESDVVLFASPHRRVISRNITFEESDHHYVKGGTEVHRRIYPRPGEKVVAESSQRWDAW